MSKIWRVEEEQIMKAGKIVGINYIVWYKDENGARTARREYRHGHYKVIPMTVLNFILDENNEATTKYQEFDGCIYKRTMYQEEKKMESINMTTAQEDIEDAIKFGWIEAQEATNTTDTEEEEEEQNMKPEYKHIYVEEARRQLEARQDRSAWDRAVTEDAIDLLDTVNDRCEQVTRQFAETEEGSAAHVNDLFVSRVSLMNIMKNGAESWHDYSWGGCGLIYDCDIAEHYCTPSELKKTRHGDRRPNSREEWLDVQARALRQAAGRAADALITASHKTYTIAG